MKTAILFLSMAMLLAACGGGENAEVVQEAELQKRAEVAERNMLKIRDAVLAYHKKNKKAPEHMGELAEFGAAEGDLEINDDYSELAYGFYNLSFDADGKLERAWFIATPVSHTGALAVRLNGVSGNFDYVKEGEEFGAAPDDEGWGNSPPPNIPNANG